MPFKDPDPTDPTMLVGIVLPANAEAPREMAYVFAEEFVRMGCTREQLLGLFKNPYYGGAHGAYRAIGEKDILSIIDECLNVWGKFRIEVQDVQPVQTDPTLSSCLPRDAGEEEFKSTSDANLRNRLNGTQRLSGLNGLNASAEESDDE